VRGANLGTIAPQVLQADFRYACGSGTLAMRLNWVAEVSTYSAGGSSAGVSGGEACCAGGFGAGFTTGFIAADAADLSRFSFILMTWLDASVLPRPRTISVGLIARTSQPATVCPSTTRSNSPEGLGRRRAVRPTGEITTPRRSKFKVSGGGAAPDSEVCASGRRVCVNNGRETTSSKLEMSGFSAGATLAVSESKSTVGAA
jgi:hypothetical protein